MVAFILLLAFFTNLNFVTLASKVNVSLTAELQFNQNDIAELEKAQMYLNEIKHNILRKNHRRLNAKRQKIVKNNEFHDNVVTSDESNANMIEYPNFINNPTNRKTETRKNKINIDIKQVTTHKQDKTRQHKNNIKHKKNKSSKNTGDQDRVTQWDIHIHDIQKKQIIKKAKPLKQNATKTTTLTTTTKTNTEKTASTKTNGVQKLKDIHIHDVHRKQIIRRAKPLKQNTTKTTTLSTTTKHTDKKTESTKTNGVQTLRDLHMHDIQSKQVIRGVKSKILQSSAKTAKHTREPSARRHNVFTNLLAQKNIKGSLTTTTEKPKDVNKITINDQNDIKDEEIDFSVKQASEKYNNLNEYLKYKASENNVDKDKEVLEKIKSDLGTLFAIKSNPTSEKADSLQELEKAFGFDM